MLLSFEQLQSIHGIYNPSEQLAYYMLSPESRNNKSFVNMQILSLKKDYFTYCVKHGIGTAEAWREIKRDALALVRKTRPAVLSHIA